MVSSDPKISPVDCGAPREVSAQREGLQTSSTWCTRATIPVVDDVKKEEEEQYSDLCPTKTRDVCDAVHLFVLKQRPFAHPKGYLLVRSGARVGRATEESRAVGCVSFRRDDPAAFVCVEVAAVCLLCSVCFVDSFCVLCFVLEGVVSSDTRRSLWYQPGQLGILNGDRIVSVPSALSVSCIVKAHQV